MTNLTLWILVGLFVAVFLLPLPAVAPGRMPDRGARRAADVALGWVVLFFALHVYWYCGGHFASPGEVPPLSTPNRVEGAAGLHSVVPWVLNAVIELAWPVGALVCLTIARGRARGRLASAAQALVWVGCVLLLLRGVAGLLDDVTRATGVLPNGITGLSLQDTTGHAHLQWSGWAIDGYFLVGGIAFLLLAIRHRGRQPGLVARGG
ncbi:hypothetical protein [Flexivirga alba]|uniref:DUF3995 domain-containing protein n=1 Tax=Flexivirga alba TaxID=702742 RepID=A0ABW2ALR0_9MICO